MPEEEIKSKTMITVVGEEGELEIEIPTPEGSTKTTVEGGPDGEIVVIRGGGIKPWPPDGKMAIRRKGDDRDHLEIKVPKGVEIMVSDTPDGGKVIRTVAAAHIRLGEVQEEEYERRWHRETPGTRHNKEYISSDDLKALIVDKLRGKFDKRCTICIADDKYYCPPLEDAGNIVGVSGVDRKKWLRQAFDCDDFAYVLKAHFAEAAYVHGKRVDRPAHCLGILFGTVCISDKEPGSHAVNWMVDDKRELHFIEPQKDYLIDPQTGRVRHINVDSETGQVSYLEIPEKFEFKDICLMLV